MKIRVEKQLGIDRNQVTLYGEIFNVLNDEFYSYSRTFDHARNTTTWEDPDKDVLAHDLFPPYYSDQSVYLLRNRPRHIRIGLVVKL